MEPVAEDGDETVKLVPVTAVEEQFALLMNAGEMNYPWPIVRGEALFAVGEEMKPFRGSQSETEVK